MAVQISTVSSQLSDGKKKIELEAPCCKNKQTTEANKQAILKKSKDFLVPEMQGIPETSTELEIGGRGGQEEERRTKKGEEGPLHGWFAYLATLCNAELISHSAAALPAEKHSINEQSHFDYCHYLQIASKPANQPAGAKLNLRF